MYPLLISERSLQQRAPLAIGSRKREPIFLAHGIFFSFILYKYLDPFIRNVSDLGRFNKYGIISFRYIAGCCPSESILIIASKPFSKAFLNPVNVAAPTPRFFL